MVVKERHRGFMRSCNVTFKGETHKDIETTQLGFIRACIKDGVYDDGETIVVDNETLNWEPGVAVFFDFVSGRCGFSHALPGVLIRLFMEISKKQRPKLHWYVRHKGETLPNPDYPFVCRNKPW